MGYGRELPWLLSVALCAAVPFYVGVYSLSSKTMNGFYWSAAAIAVACGLFLLFAVVTRHTRLIQRDMRKLANELSSLMRESREERRVAADLSAQVSVLRAESEGLASSLSIDMHELRQSQISLATDLRGMVERQYQMQSQSLAAPRRTMVVHPSQWSAVEAEKVPATAVAQQKNGADVHVAEAVEAVPVAKAVVGLEELSNADEVVISLEPVIDLFSGKTAHYRMHFTTPANDEMTGVRRPALDVHLYREALMLLRRLRKRDSRLKIFVPLGASTLGTPQALARIVHMHAGESGLSDGVIVDVPHAILAGLPQTSIEGLAYLARAGLEMSLSNAAVSGLDLTAMDKLNVRYVAISSGSVGQEPKQSAGIANFVQAARALHVQVIVTGVANAQQATQLMRVARFAAGPAFAEPRRVRRDAALGHATEELNAAAE